MAAIDYTIGTAMKIEEVSQDTFEISGADRCLYDHDEDKWDQIIDRSKRVSRFTATVRLRPEVEVICGHEKVRLGLEKRLRSKSPSDRDFMLRKCTGFTFPLG